MSDEPVGGPAPVDATANPAPTLALPAGEGLTREDVRRSGDRLRVLRARRAGRRWLVLWLLVGPGVLVMLGENDGPSMLSYAASGASYGVGFFVPFILATFVAAAVIQEMALRLGAVSHRGFGELVTQRFGRTWGWFTALDLAVTNLITLVAEFVALRVGMGYFGISDTVAVGLGVLLVLASLLLNRYWSWERTALALALFNVAFVAAAVLAYVHGQPFSAVVGAWQPHTGGSLQGFLLLVASDIGATVTPWMLFFQQSAVADKGLTPRDLRLGRIDTYLGAGFAALAGIGALVAAAPLYAHRVTPGGHGTAFAQALEPLVGRPAAALFALGLIEAGALASLTISASTAYALGEVLRKPHSFNRSIRDEPFFHLVYLAAALVAAAIVLVPGAPLLSIVLNVNLLGTVLLPPALVFLLVLANDRELLGSRANGRLRNLAGGAIVVVVATAATAYTVVAFANTVGG